MRIWTILVLMTAALLAKDPKLKDRQKVQIREAQIAFERIKFSYDAALAKLNAEIAKATPKGYEIHDMPGEGLKLVKKPETAEADKPAGQLTPTH